MSLPDWIRNTETDLPDIPGFPPYFGNSDGVVTLLQRPVLRGRVGELPWRLWHLWATLLDCQANPVITTDFTLKYLRRKMRSADKFIETGLDGIEHVGFATGDAKVIRLRYGPRDLPGTRIAVCNIRCLPDVFYESRLGIVQGLNRFFWVFENSDGGVAYIGRSDYNLRGEMR
jgi:hypothetical protein